MSPLWPSRLHISITSGRISVSKSGAGIRRQVTAKHDEAIDASLLDSPWQVLAEKLELLLSKPELQAAGADIVLSNKLVRHAVIPFNSQLKKYSEHEAFARHVLSKTYAADTAQWELRLQRQGDSWIVSAVDRALLENLRQVCAAHKVKLRSVTSRLVHVYNHHRHAVQAEPSWLISHEPGYSQFAMLNERKIVALNRVNHQTANELPWLLDRENLVAGLPEPCRTVYIDVEVDLLPSFPGEQYAISPLDVGEERDVASPAGRLRSWRGGPKRFGRVALDFQKPAEQPNRKAGWMLLVTGIVLLFEMGISYDRLQNERVAMEREVKESKLRLDEADTGTRYSQFTDKDFAAARTIIDRLATPWDAFFTGLESVSNERVAILSLAPDMQTGILRIEGEAKDFAAVLTLVAQLRATKPFSEVYLSSHEMKRDDADHGVKFVISTHWVKSAT